MDQQISKQAFAEMVMERLREAGEKKSITYQAESFSLRGETEQIFLTNFYHEYCSTSPENQDQVIRHGIRAWFGAHREMPEEFNDAKPDVLPAVRSRGFFESSRLQSKIDPKSWVFCPYKPLGEHYGIGVVFDLPESMAFITERFLADWNITFEEVLDAAIANLRELPVKILGPASGKGSYAFLSNDGYNASRIIFLSESGHFNVEGNLIAAIPNREELFVTGSEDEHGLQSMLKFLTEGMQKPRPISGIVLCHDGEDWSPWLPDQSHPLYCEYRECFLKSLGEEYSTQKELLDKHHAELGKDIFVANYGGLVGRVDNQPFSYSVWGEGIDTLLPLTDLFAIVDSAGKVSLVGADKAVQVVGHLMEPTDYYPLRYRVRQFPTEEQRTTMGNNPPD